MSEKKGVSKPSRPRITVQDGVTEWAEAPFYNTISSPGGVVNTEEECAESAEEAVAEIAGNIADAVIMGQNGTFARRVQELMASGMTREKAEEQTLKELYLINVGKAAAQGAIAGGMLGAGAAGGAFVGRSSYSREAKRTYQREVQTAYESVGDAVLKSNITAEQLVQAAAASGNEDAIEAAQRMSAALERGEEPSTADIGRLHLLAGGYISGYQARLAEGGGQNAETEKEAKKDTTSYMSEGENAGNIHDNVSSKGEFASEKNTQTQQGENNAPVISEAKSGADITETAAQMQQNEPQNVSERSATYQNVAQNENVASKATSSEEVADELEQRLNAGEGISAELQESLEGEFRTETPNPEQRPDVAGTQKFRPGDRIRTKADGEGTVVWEGIETTRVRLDDGTEKGYKTDTLTLTESGRKAEQIADEKSAEAAQTPEVKGETESQTKAEAAPREESIGERVRRVQWEQIQKTATRKAKAGLTGDAPVLNRTQRRLFDKIAKTLGVEVHFVGSIANGDVEANGLYKNGHVFIARDAENPFQVVLGHEITHHFEKSAPKAYEKFKAAVFAYREYTESETKKYMREYGLDKSSAEHEIIADFAQELLRDDSARKIKALIRASRSGANGFYGAMHRVFDKIRGTKDSTLGEYDAQMKEITDLWKACLREANENRGKAEADGEVQMSRKESQQETALEEDIDLAFIRPLNEVKDQKKFNKLLSAFKKSGWNGRPLVVIDNGNEGHIALTGSHRIAAAKEAGIEVPAIVLDNTEDTARLIDVDDDERERIAKELAEDGIIPQRAYDLLAQENDLNYANEPQFSRKTNAAQAEITARYQQTVSDILSGKKTVTDAVLMGYTPDIYQALGVPSLPFVIGPGHIYSIAKTEAEAKTDGKYNKRTHYHGLGDDAVKNLYEAAQNPIAVIAAKDVDAKATPMRSTHSVVAIIDVGTANKSRLVPIEITAERHMGNDMLDVNVVSSVYDRNVENLLAEAVAQENTGEIGVYYIKKEAVPLVSARVQFPEHLHKAIASDGIVHLVPEKVNMRIENQTQSRQFKRWFGDWQNDPKNASKVVNEDGTPKVVYHGTNENFTVFDASKGRANMDIQGMFFSPWEIEAGGYGENVRAFYLNIRKPASEAAAYKALNAHKGENGAGIKAREDLIKQKYDGVNNSDEEYIAFYPEQIKSATDNIGTFDQSNPDIRYSRKGQDSRIRELERLARENARLKEQFKRTKGIRLKESDIRKIARGIIKDYDITDYDKEQLYERLKPLAEAAALSKDGTDAQWERIREYARAVARDVGENALVPSEDAEYMRETYHEMRGFLKGTRVLNPWAIDPNNEKATKRNKELRDYYRKKLFGTLTLTSDPSDVTDLGVVYRELTERFGEGFFPSDKTNSEDMLIKISDVLDDLKSVARKTAGEDGGSRYDDFYEAIAQDIIGRIADVREDPTFADKKAAEKAAAVAKERERAKERVNKLVAKERKRREAAVSKLKDKYKAKTAEARELKNLPPSRYLIIKDRKMFSQKSSLKLIIVFNSN